MIFSKIYFSDFSCKIFFTKVGTIWTHFGALVKQHRARIVSVRRLSHCLTEKCNASDRSTAGQPFTRLEVGVFAKKKWDPNGPWHYQHRVGAVPKYIVYKFSNVTMIFAAMRPQNLTEQPVSARTSIMSQLINTTTDI